MTILPTLRRQLLQAAAVSLVALMPMAHADAPHDHGGKPTAKNGRERAMKIAPQKPNGSGIVVRYRLDGTPVRGQVVPVELALERVVGTDASVRFETDSGLQLGNGADPQALMAGRQASLMVDVTPSTEGTTYLHVFTTQNGITSVASIPVNVGKGGAMRSLGELKPLPDGDKIISMPVR